MESNKLNKLKALTLIRIGHRVPGCALCLGFPSYSLLGSCASLSIIYRFLSQSQYPSCFGRIMFFPFYDVSYNCSESINKISQRFLKFQFRMNLRFSVCDTIRSFGFVSFQLYRHINK